MGFIVFIVLLVIILIIIFRKLAKKDEYNNYDENSNNVKTLRFTVSHETSTKPYQEKRFLKKEIVFLSDYTVIDTETTGISDTDKIIEISALRIRQSQIENTFERLINPEMHINSGATKVNGISDDMVENCPTFREVENDFLDFIGDDVLVGHNVTFDLKFINRELSYNLKNDFQDTLLISRKLISNIQNYKLVTLSKYLKIQDFQTHRAVGDAEITYKLYEALKKKNNGKSLYTTYSEVIKDFSNIYKGNVKKVSKEQYWKDIENNTIPPYFTNWDKIDVEENPSYDEISIENLIKTSMLDRSNTSIERINKQYRFIKDEIEKIGGRVYKRGAKSAKSYIEFYYSDYSEFKQIKADNLKLYHSSDVVNFINNHEDDIKKFVENENLLKHKKEEEQRLLIEKNRQEKQHQRELKRKEIEKKLAEKENLPIRILVQMDDSGKIINKYKTLAEAAKTVGVNSKSIRECCKGTQKHAGGFVWKYEEIINNNKDEQ